MSAGELVVVPWRGETSGSNRVQRGGSWNNNAQNCRSANRNRNDPGNRNNNLGASVEHRAYCLTRTVHGRFSCAAGPVQILVLPLTVQAWKVVIHG